MYKINLIKKKKNEEKIQIELLVSIDYHDLKKKPTNI